MLYDFDCQHVENSINQKGESTINASKYMGMLIKLKKMLLLF